MRAISIERCGQQQEAVHPSTFDPLACSTQSPQKKMSFIEEDISKILIELQSLRLRIARVNLNSIQDVQPDVVPPSFLCPITHDVMKDPYIVVETGHSYERVSIASWLAFNKTDPKTNNVLTNKALVPNHTLRGAIDDFFSVHSRSKRTDGVNQAPRQRMHYVIRVWTHDVRSGRIKSTDAHVALDLPTAELVCLLHLRIQHRNPFSCIFVFNIEIHCI
jgi:hypothetical protein